MNENDGCIMSHPDIHSFPNVGKEGDVTVSRKEAKTNGFQRYFTGIACVNGHICERKVYNGQCIECKPIYDRKYRENHSKEKADHARAWRAKNATKYKEGQKIRIFASREKKRALSIFAGTYNQMSSRQARSLGVTLYFTGKPCSRGHVDFRYARDGFCMSCNKEQRSKWEKNNSEKIQAWRKTNIFRLKEYAKKWRTKNPEKVREASRRVARNNPNAARIRRAKWAKNNRTALRARDCTRRAKKVSAPGKFTRSDINDLWNCQGGKCVYCDQPLTNFQIDHIVALAKGGSNWPSNLQLLCPTCNARKGAKSLIDFLTMTGEIKMNLLPLVYKFATYEPVFCCVCRRRSHGIGYTPKQGRPIFWVCAAPECSILARKVYTMPSDTLDAYELKAMHKGGADAGIYIDSIGMTDLAKLTADQWEAFLRHIVTGYEHELRRCILAHEAPF